MYATIAKPFGAAFARLQPAIGCETTWIWKMAKEND
jgi:hypothetical protein